MPVSSDYDLFLYDEFWLLAYTTFAKTTTTISHHTKHTHTHVYTRAWYVGLEKDSVAREVGGRNPPESPTLQASKHTSFFAFSKGTQQIAHREADRGEMKRETTATALFSFRALFRASTGFSVVVKKKRSNHTQYLSNTITLRIDWSDCFYLFILFFSCSPILLYHTHTRAHKTHTSTQIYVSKRY